MPQHAASPSPRREPPCSRRVTGSELACGTRLDQRVQQAAASERVCARFVEPLERRMLKDRLTNMLRLDGAAHPSATRDVRYCSSVPIADLVQKATRNGRGVNG